MPRLTRSPMGTYYRALHRVERRALNRVPGTRHTFYPNVNVERRAALIREAVALTNRLYWQAVNLPEAIEAVA